MKTGSSPIPKWISSVDKTDWSDDVWRRTHFAAFVVAKNKAKLTGRLVSEEGEVLEEVRHLGRSFGRGAE
jgi:hypothetical protein